MDLHLLSTKMEVGIVIRDTPEAGVEGEVEISVVVDEEGIIMALRLMPSKMQEVTMKKHLFKAMVLLQILAFCSSHVNVLCGDVSDLNLNDWLFVPA